MTKAEELLQALKELTESFQRLNEKVDECLKKVH